MDTKSLSLTELTDILEKIEAVLIGAGLPKGSVEIKFQNTNELEIQGLTTDINGVVNKGEGLPPGCSYCAGKVCCPV